MSRSVMPVLGNLAWAPLASLDELEVLDRFNGVPTLGIVRGSAGSHLFWRVMGYVSEHVSCWLYAPLTPAEDAAMDDAEDGRDPLTPLLDRPASGAYVTVSVAWDNRLIFEREWALPTVRALDDLIGPYLSFVAEALEISITQDLPASRREAIVKASEAVRELVHC